MAPVDIESALLGAIADAGSLADTGDFAERLGVDHLAVVGVMKSLISDDYVVAKVRTMRGGAAEPAPRSHLGDRRKGRARASGDAYIFLARLCVAMGLWISSPRA